jgi:cathepsin L
MRNRYAGLAMVGVAVAATLYMTKESFMGSVVLNQSTFSEEEQAFVKFMSHHRKSYGTKEEYDFRLDIFRKTLDTIKTENANPANTFTLGLNKFADWSPAEWKRVLSYRPTRPMRNAMPQNLDETNSILIPSEIDWRNLDAVNPVRDQGQCGSCWAFSAASSMESRYKIFNGTLYMLSV